MKIKHLSLKHKIEKVLGIYNWSPNEVQIYKIAKDVGGEELSRGKLYQIVTKNYKGTLYLELKKGMDFQTMNDLLEIALLASEIREDE